MTRGKSALTLFASFRISCPRSRSDWAAFFALLEVKASNKKRPASFRVQTKEFRYGNLRSEACRGGEEVDPHRRRRPRLSVASLPSSQTACAASIKPPTRRMSTTATTSSSSMQRRPSSPARSTPTRSTTGTPVTPAASRSAPRARSSKAASRSASSRRPSSAWFRAARSAVAR